MPAIPRRNHVRCQVPGCMRTACEEHHICTRGAWGPAAEVEENKIPVCRICHTEWHATGVTLYAEEHGLMDVVETARAVVWKKRREMETSWKTVKA